MTRLSGFERAWRNQGRLWRVERRGGETYLYWRGQLVWKRWDDQGLSILFDAVGLPRRMREGE